MDAVRTHIARTFSDRRYQAAIDRANKANWLRIRTSVAFDRITKFLETLD